MKAGKIAKIVALAVCLALAAAALPAAPARPAEAAAQGVRIYVNGVQIRTDVPPYVAPSGRVMVPVRFVAEALGARVDWDAGTRTVTVERGGVTVKLRIGQSKALAGSKTVYLDAPAVIRSGRTMVPLRFVSEALGAVVEWRAAEKVVWITDAQAPPAPGGGAGGGSGGGSGTSGGAGGGAQTGGLAPLERLPILSEADLDRMGLAKLPHWTETTPWPGWRPTALWFVPGSKVVTLVYWDWFGDFTGPKKYREVETSGPVALTEVKDSVSSGADGIPGTADDINYGGPYVLANWLEAVFGPNWRASAHWDAENQVLTIRGTGRTEKGETGYPVRYVQIGLGRATEKDGHKYKAKLKWVDVGPDGRSDAVAYTLGDFEMRNGQIITYNVLELSTLIANLNGEWMSRYDSAAYKFGKAGVTI